ncbi:MAG: hypothetical protein AABY30_01335 [Candidatus Thermoplasmatota archaeon]
MDRALRIAAIVAVVAMAVPPALEFRVIEQGNQLLGASAILVLAASAGVWAAYRRRPLAARITTAVYGAFGIGLGLFATDRSVAHLLAYIVGLLGMNVLLYHAAAYGPVLAAFREEDAVSRRARAVVLRSLGISGVALAAAYGGSLLLLPAFALDVGPTDPLSALAVATGLLVLVLLLSLLPDVSLRRKALRRP